MSSVTPGGEAFGDWLDAEPSAAELAAIEAEWPVIAAELVLLDDEIAQLGARAVTEPIVHRRVRRSRRRVIRRVYGTAVAS